MKKLFLLFAIFVAALVIALPCLLYFQRESRATLICTSLDDTIRPRDYCLMNPFRDTQPEKFAESILSHLKNADAEILQPYTENYDQIAENEKNWKINGWRISGREIRNDRLRLGYWVTRDNYNDSVVNPYEEEVNFEFDRNGDEWRLSSFGAIY